MDAAKQTMDGKRGGYELAMRVTGLARGTLWSLVSRKKIPHRRLSARIVVFDRDELEQWLDAHRVAAGG